jgi:hypothetical protein
MSIFTHSQVTHRVPRFQQITTFDPVHNLFHYTTTNPSIYMFGQPLPAFEPHPSCGHTVTVTRMAHAPSRPHPLTGAATRRRRADSATPAPASTASERPPAHGGSTTSSGPMAPPPRGTSPSTTRGSPQATRCAGTSSMVGVPCDSNFCR